MARIEEQSRAGDDARADAPPPDEARPDPWQRYRPLAAAGPAALLVLVALWELLAVALVGGGAADDGDWRRAAEALRSRHQPGELIVFSPDWLDPVGRKHLGDLIPVEMAARMDAARYGVIWEISARGARADATEDARLVDTEEFGRLELRRYEQEPAEVATDFVAAFARAQVAGGSAAVRLEEVGFQPHRCVRAVPRPGQPVTITYPTVELGTALVGYVGLADVFTRRDIRDPGHLTVSVGGEVVAELSPGVDDGWVRFESPTEPGTAEVVFSASADAPQRLICFAAEARR